MPFGISMRRSLLGALVMTMAGVASGAGVAQDGAASGGHDRLVALFREWRAFETPPLRAGAPDYTAGSLARRHEALRGYQARLAAIATRGWPVEQQVDWHLLRAEMNGFDFYVRVLRPWESDPAFYRSIWTAQSDTPAHEGPCHHALVELWTYAFPLDRAGEARLARELQTVAPLLAQARVNLTGDARDLWITGIGTMRQQAQDLAGLGRKVANGGAALRRAVRAAQQATQEFVAWLEQEAPSKTGPSGIGKEHYTWSLRHVHLVPMSWEDEVMLLKRELARAHASLRLEEQRNRALPPLPPIASEADYERRGNEAITRYVKFLQERRIMPIRPWTDAALRPRIGRYEPEATRDFFAIAAHHEPLTLYTHFYHWWDLAQMREEPHASPIRRAPLLYNIWDSRAEGMATAAEEMMMHAGLYDEQPRAREIVWIMLAQRAARGLAALHAHANELDIRAAKDFQVRWTPRGWMSPHLDLLHFEQQLYLRQPGYGTSYVTGKHLIEDLLRERAAQLGRKFELERFFAELNAAGMIPVSLLRWQMTGDDAQIRALLQER